MVGGTETAVAEMRKMAKQLDIADKVHFTGQVPPESVPFYLSLADALVSPRISGTNTPLKIYSFLKSGKPLVATNLWTHTQVLNPEIAILVKPDPESLAAGISKALFDQQAKTQASAAKALADSEFTLSNYLKKITLVLNQAVRQNSP